MTFTTLDNVDHAELRVAVRAGAAFGDHANLLPVMPIEFEEAQRELPIVFRRGADGGIRAYVLLGLDRGENLFLDGDRWTTRFVPAIQRRGPFALARGDDGEPVVQVDRDDPRVGVADGLPLFRDHGGGSPYLEHVRAALTLLAEGAQSERAIHADWEAAGLLRGVTLRIDLGDAGGYEVSDVLTIDQAALAALSGATLERLHANGLLRAATMAAASLGNIERLVELKTIKEGA
ncbi:SapC family protein [uncultured Sphingomonas sp.]|uniref:SapC family protein n=1 Tax=uncultured Sphingomonas sp. TaxID=158754 RepID=UPI0030FAD2B9